MTDVLKFSEKTLTILKNYSSINQSIYFNEGSTVSTISPSKFVMAYSNIDETIDTPFAIYELSKFLSVLSLFDNPDIFIKEHYCEIKEKNKSVTYTFCDPENIRVPPKLSLVESELSEPLVEFSLTEKEIKGILKGTSILRSPQIAIQSMDGKIVIKGVNTEKPSDNSYSISIGDTEDEFSIFLKVEFIRLMDGDYNVAIHKVGGNALILKFYNDTTIYFNAVEPTSYFN